MATTPPDLVPVDRQVAREAGFLFPVFLARAVYEDCVAWTDDDSDRTDALQDEAGRLWDVVYLAAGVVRRYQVTLDFRPGGLRFRVDRVSRTLRPGEAAEREWAGEEIADQVSLVVRRGAGAALIIDFAEAVAR